MFVGVLVYADDFVLLTPTPNAMRELLTICDDFSSEFDVTFNSMKSKCLYFHAKTAKKTDATLPDFFIGGNHIEFVESWNHLGHTLYVNLDDSSDILKRRSSLVAQANDVLCYFGNLAVVTKLKLFLAYCSSLYGSQLWDIQYDNVEALCLSWRKALRRLWNLPAQTHCDLLYRICNCWPLKDELYRRCLLFSLRCLRSENRVVNYVAKCAIVYEKMRSPMGRNFINGCIRFNISIDFG